MKRQITFTNKRQVIKNRDGRIIRINTGVDSQSEQDMEWTLRRTYSSKNFGKPMAHPERGGALLTPYASAAVSDLLADNVSQDSLYRGEGAFIAGVRWVVFSVCEGMFNDITGFEVRGVSASGKVGRACFYVPVPLDSPDYRVSAISDRAKRFARAKALGHDTISAQRYAFSGYIADTSVTLRAVWYKPNNRALALGSQYTWQGGEDVR